MIIGIMAGILISISFSYVIADTLVKSEDVYYDKTSSGLAVNNVQAAIDGTCTKFSNQLTTLKQEILDEVYPVGSIYISTTLKTTTEVQNKFGGTWASYGVGKTLLSSTTSEQTGGSNTVTLKEANLPAHTHNISHTHTTSEIDTTTVNLTAQSAGSHQHTIYLNTNQTGTYTIGAWDRYLVNGTGITQSSTALYNRDRTWPGCSASGEHTHTVTGSVTIPSLSTNSISTTTSGSTGGGKSFSVQNEYITVYMYKRTK